MLSFPDSEDAPEVVPAAGVPAAGSVPELGGGGGASVLPVFLGAVSTINGGVPEPAASTST